MNKDERLTAKVATLYYIKNLTQEEIGRQLGISRQMVGRILKDAKEKGVVEIRVNSLAFPFLSLEEKLESRYGLKEAVVVACESDDDEVAKMVLGRAGAQYISDHLEDHMILGISWGRTMAKVAESLVPRKTRGVKIVQLNGGLGRGGRLTNAGQLVIEFSTAFGAESYLLNAPAIVESMEASKAIRSAYFVSSVFEIIDHTDMCVFSIGTLDQTSVLLEAGYITSEEARRLISLGCVGDICGRWFNEKGEIVDKDLNERTIGIQLETLRQKKFSVAIAGGNHKVKAIRAALTQRYCNVLITDEYTARELLGDQ